MILLHKISAQEIGIVALVFVLGLGFLFRWISTERKKKKEENNPFKIKPVYGDDDAFLGIETRRFWAEHKKTPENQEKLNKLIADYYKFKD